MARIRKTNPPKRTEPETADRGEKVKIPLPFDEAIRAALEVQPMHPRKNGSSRKKAKGR